MKQRKKRTIETKHREPRSIESFMMVNGETGDVFFSNKQDKDITAIASYYERQVRTERVIVVSISDDPKAERVTKITIL